MSDSPPLYTIPAAARAAETPERSLYRAVDAGEVPSTTRDGIKLVTLDDVVTWREARKAARPSPPPPEATATAAPTTPLEASARALPAPAASGGNAAAASGGGASGSAAAPAIDGPLWAKLFGLLIDRVPPEEIVRREAVSPDLAELAVQKFNSLRAAGQHEDALVSLKRELAKLAAEVAGVWPSIGAAQQSADEAVFKIPAVKRELEERLASLEQRVAAIERYLRTGG